MCYYVAVNKQSVRYLKRLRFYIVFTSKKKIVHSVESETPLCTKALHFHYMIVSY